MTAEVLDAWVEQFAPGGQRVTHCTCSRTGHHLATFTRRPGLSLYTLTTASPPVSTSGQVAASSQVFAAVSRSSPASAPCWCRPLSHETLLWHHRLGHPSLPRLRGMASRSLVSGLPRSLPPLPPGPAPTCVLCVEGRQRAASHSSTFPPTEAPLQTLHMDVRGEVPEVLINWIRGARRQRSESFGSDLSVLRLHSDRGGEFSSDLMRAFCRAEGIRQTFILPASPQKNGIAERRIGMVMDVARTSMIHTAAPHFLWPFAVQYAAHQINLQPRVSFPKITPTLRWTGRLAMRPRSVSRDLELLSVILQRTNCPPVVFPVSSLASLLTHPRGSSTTPPRVVFCPLRTSRVDPAEPVEVAVDSGAARGSEPAGAGTGGAGTGVAEPGRAEPGGAEPGRVEPEGTASGGAEPASAESGCALGAAGTGATRAAGGAAGDVRGAAGAGAAGVATGAGGAAGAGADGAARGAAGAAGGAAGVGGAAGTVAAGVARGAAGAGAAGAAGGTSGAAGGATGAGAVGAGGGAAGAGAVGAVGGDAWTGDPRAEGTSSVSAVSGGAAWPRPSYVPLLQQVLGSPPSPGPPPPFLSPPPVQSQSQLPPASPLPGPSPFFGPTRGLTERREPESRSASPVRTVRAVRASRPRPPPVPGTHSMTLRPSTAPQHVPLPSPPASSLPAGPNPASDSLRAASPAVTRFLATAVTDPLFEFTVASALVTELVDFAAACRLDYATSLVAESASASVCPPSIWGECALSTDVLEDRQEEFECFAATVPHLVSMLLALEGDPDAPDIRTPHSYAEAIEGPYSSQWQAAMDA
ncbi:unnamed protein product [Closterium sp. NIES-54]